MIAIIGTCSICGGPVAVQSPWTGHRAPVPQCNDCEAVAVGSFGPVIEMRKAKDSEKWVRYVVGAVNVMYPTSTTPKPPTE